MTQDEREKLAERAMLCAYSLRARAIGMAAPSLARDETMRAADLIDEMLAALRSVGLGEEKKYYLNSILRQLKEFRSATNEALCDGGNVSMLGGQALADNIDWLDCFINRLSQSPAPAGGGGDESNAPNSCSGNEK